MKKVSSKQSKINKELKKVYKQIDEERTHYCVGCGKTGALSHSHLIPRSRRPDLVLSKNNIVFHCMDGKDGRKGCHQLWEGGTHDKQKLLSYHSHMEYILVTDVEYYFLIND